MTQPLLGSSWKDGKRDRSVPDHRADQGLWAAGSRESATFAADFFPPDFGNWKLYLSEMLVTVQIALWGTVLAIVCAIPLSILASENIVPWWVYQPVRRVMDACRSINEMVFAMLFVVAVGLGPFAGVLALFISTTGVLAKLFAEAVEAIDPGPVEGVRATGASALQEVIFGVIPQVLPLWISYSLYLWHWPLYVFVQYHALETLGLPARLGLLAASIGLAALSLYYVEAPFRERKLFAGRRQMLGAALCSLLLLGVVGQLVRHYDGVPSRLSEEALRYAKASKWRDGQTDCMFDKKALSQESICRFPAELAAERPLLVSWGDSHSAALSPLLRELAASRRVPIWQASLAGCPPLLGMLEKDNCLRFNQQMLEFVEQQRPGGVILAGRWDMYVYGDSQDGTRNILREPDDTPDSSIAEALLRQRLSGMIERLNAADVHVWLVKDVPLLPFKAPARLVRLSLSGEDVGRARFPFAEHTARVAYVNALFDALAEGNPRVSVIDPSSVLCDGLDCFAERDGWSLYMDNNHLSTQGAHELGPLFEPMLQSLDDSRIASQQ